MLRLRRSGCSARRPMPGLLGAQWRQLLGRRPGKPLADREVEARFCSAPMRHVPDAAAHEVARGPVWGLDLRGSAVWLWWCRVQLCPCGVCWQSLARLKCLYQAGSVPVAWGGSGMVEDSVAGSAGEGWDFFVSYAQADRGWAEWIAWQLEQDGYQVLIQAWD